MPSAAPIATKSNPRSDAHRLQPSPQVVSLLPRDRRRAVSTKVFARSLGEHMARNRHGRAIASFFPQQMARFRAAASATGLTHDAMAAQVFAAMQADETNDRGADATDQAIARTQRALLAVLVENYGREIRIEGWIPGEIVKGPFIGSRRRLTGRACPKCLVNPSCYSSHGAGTRCLDDHNCGRH